MIKLLAGWIETKQERDMDPEICEVCLQPAGKGNLYIYVSNVVMKRDRPTEWWIPHLEVMMVAELCAECAKEAGIKNTVTDIRGVVVGKLFPGEQL